MLAAVLTQRARAALARSSIAIPLCGLALVALPSTAAASAGAPPAAIPLSGGWQFRADPLDVGAGERWFDPTRAGNFSPTVVPGVFDPDPQPQSFAGAVGWYRVSFDGPPTPAGFAWAVQFGQVRRRAHVWLNGVPIGAHDDPYTAFTLPLTGLRSGARNTLVVRVDNRKGVEPREGWWNWGGIPRPVTLVPQGPVVLATPGLLPQLHCSAPGVCRGDVLFDGWVTNRSPRPLAPTVAVTLTAPSTHAVSRASFTAAALAPGQTRRLRFPIAVTGTPQLWAPGHPALYAASIVTLVNGQAAQADSLAIGLRKVEARGGQLYLNDQPLELSGASIEEDVPGRGPALTPADMDLIVAQLRAIHANVTRAQYPLSPALLDRLDRAGILVWSQAPIYHRDELLQTRAQRQLALATLRGTVLAARDHPSVITHSVANELSPTPDATPRTRTYLEDAAALTRDLDPTLPVSLDLLSYPGYPPQRTYELFPLLGVNNYFGWYPSRAPHSTASIAGLAPYLRSLHAAYPRAAIVMTEFGAEATVPGPGSQKQTFAYQRRYIAQTLSIVHQLSFIDGAIYWTLREFAVKPYWNGGPHRGDVPYDSIHHKGLLTYYGDFRKPAWSTVAEAFATTPLYRAAAEAGDLAALIAAAAALAAIGVLLGLQLWAFAGIRRAPPPASAQVLPWPEDSAVVRRVKQREHLA